MTAIQALKRRWWALRALRSVPGRFLALLNDEQSPSYFQQAPRKSRAHIALELLWWLLRHREINPTEGTGALASSFPGASSVTGGTS